MNAHLDDDFIERQRQRLEALRAELLGTEAHIRDDERDAEAANDETREFGDEARATTDIDMRTELHAVDQRQLRAIERALEKIADDTYGFSDLSGDPIPKPRLEAVPEALLTVAEEEKAESAV